MNFFFDYIPEPSNSTTTVPALNPHSVTKIKYSTMPQAGQWHSALVILIGVHREYSNVLYNIFDQGLLTALKPGLKVETTGSLGVHSGAH